ncbi:hypothetical protein [Devosia sp. 1566]|uniref:hypothetical protein n=1 Tax=Devosia sp. 1566 TaxID=2499144 RepID=UPI000FD919DE|nr:hypothetical protein [Devosia sp. 1566]
MDRVRPYFEEVTRALLVLALVLLNLVPAPAPAVAYDGLAFTNGAVVYCGDGGPGDNFSHAPCHACRLGGDAVLPPPPCHSEHIALQAVPVVYPLAEVVSQDDLHSIANRSRGPPLHA